MNEASTPIDPVLAGVRMYWGVKIPLRDGVRLNATVYLPKDHARPSPAVVTLTPYIAQTYHDQAMYFAAHGFPFLVVDVRGRGNSEGSFRPLLNEARDGFDVIEWIAQQPYCNHRVAMWGGSYAGHAQWSTASQLPPHLASIVPAASPYVGVDFPMTNNVAEPYLMQWLTLVAGRTSQDKMFWNNEAYWGARFREWLESGVPFKELDRLLGNPSDVFQEWLAHPHLDAYWDSYNPTAEQYAGLTIPVLTITGSCDGNQPGALTHYREHLRNAASGAQHYLVIGPWDHAGTRTPKREFCGLSAGPASLVDLQKLHLEWYAWTMQDGPRPEFLRKNVAYYVMGAERWRYADTLEAITARSVPFYLQSTGNPTDVLHSGSLTAEPSGDAAPDWYVYDPHDVDLAEIESTVEPASRVDQRMVYAAVGRRLVYHSAPLKEAAELSGFFKLAAWLSIDGPDTDFHAAIYEIDLHGGSVLLTSDWIRARYRTSARQSQLIRTQEPLQYRFENFPFVSRLVRQGSRLRLVIGPLNSIYFQKNYNSGGAIAAESMRDARAVTVKLFHDRERPSALHVPYGHAN